MITPQDQKEIAAMDIYTAVEQPANLGEVIQPRPLTSADFAKLIKRNEELRSHIEQALNWCDLGFPTFARKQLLVALNAPKELINHTPNNE